MSPNFPLQKAKGPHTISAIADSWFLESNSKMVQLGFSLIKNWAPHGQILVHSYTHNYYTHNFWPTSFANLGSLENPSPGIPVDYGGVIYSRYSVVQPENNGSTREQSSHLSQSELVSWWTWPGVKSIVRWTQKPSPVWGSILIRENPNCTILPLDSRNQESAQSPGY